MNSTPRQEFIENAAMYFDRLGMSRTAGRVMGWLPTSPEGDADAPRLCAEIAVAKNSMSGALRQLDRNGLIDRYRPARQRRDHYRLAEDVFARAFRAKMAGFDEFRALAAQGLLAVGDDPVSRRRLQRMADMYEFMARGFPKLLDRWEREYPHRQPQ